jgi:uncharacterized protein (DUF58 family)
VIRLLTWPMRVPGRVLASLRSARRLRLTREGRYFVGITIGIGIAAINTGNNLLYLLLGWLLSMIIASGILSDICLRGIRIRRTAPRRIFANRPFLMELEASNTKKRLASYSLEVEDVCEGQTIDKRCYFLKIPEGKSQQTAYRHTINRRGLYTFEGYRIATKFPFGLFTKSRHEENSTQVLVFPATRSVPLPPPTGQRIGDNLTHKVGRRGEFFGLREYRDGDDRRSIHWRSSARSDRLMVREYEDESQRRMTILVDNALPKSRGEAEDQALEDAISLCASLAQTYLERGYALRLIARGTLLPFAAGDMQTQRVLRALALLPTVDDSVPWAAHLGAQSEAVLVVPRGITAMHRPTQLARTLEAPL